MLRDPTHVHGPHGADAARRGPAGRWRRTDNHPGDTQRLKQPARDFAATVCTIGITVVAFKIRAVPANVVKNVTFIQTACKSNRDVIIY